MKTTVIIQARMGSTRLPGKVLKLILGQPILARMIDRVKLAKTLDQIIIATSTKSADSAIVRLAKKLNIAYFRGPETDVLSRYYQAAQKFSADPIVRLTGDCPLIDPSIIDQAVTAFKADSYDYVSNVHRRSYPRGMDVEVFSFKALKTAWSTTRSSYDREHVTPFIYNPSNNFKLKHIIAPSGLHRPELRLVVDEMADLKLVRQIYRWLYPQKPQFKLEDILHLLDQHPQLISLNRSVAQKASSHQRPA